MDISIQGNNRSPSLAVPSQAITFLEGRNVVFKLEGNEKILPAEVDIEPSVGGWSKINSGIQAGEEIVIGKTFFIKSLILKSKMGEGHSH